MHSLWRSTASALAAVFLALTVSPVGVGAQNAAARTQSEQRRIGREELNRRVQRFGTTRDPRWRRDVGDIVERLRRAANVQTRALTWELVGDSSMAASVWPGGIMIVNVGLPLGCDRYAREARTQEPREVQQRYTSCLATVLGHELAHVKLGHANSNRQWDGRAFRSEEFTADTAGAGYLVRAGWTVQQALDLYRALADEEPRGYWWHERHVSARERMAALESYRTGIGITERQLAAGGELIVIGGIRFAMSAAEVRGALGPPARQNPMAGWQYDSRGLALRVDSTRGVHEISLSVPSAGVVAGVRIGDTRDSALEKLGPPVSERFYFHGEKILEFSRDAFRVSLMVNGDRVVHIVATNNQ